MTKTILVIGGYGVFGGHVARMLCADPALDVVVAGRDEVKAQDFCRMHGGRPQVFDRNDFALGEIVNTVAPFAIIDSAAPFQTYADDTYKIAQLAIDCGAHYLDLSDDSDFTAGIVRLDGAAREACVTVLSGVSSVPALSAAAVEKLSEGLGDVHLIESVILPGNRAPRGLSVIKAILAQAGRPLSLWRDGGVEAAPGWSDLCAIDLDAGEGFHLRKRWASLIGAPDLALFPDYFKARSVLFRAGLELKIMHGALAVLSLPVRWGWVSSIVPLASPLKWIADRLEPFGSDEGGMRVRVLGVTREKHMEERTWTLVAKGGDGPSIPAVSAVIMINNLINSDVLAGARPCLAEFSLQEAEEQLAQLQTRTAQHQQVFNPVFAEVLEESFEQLPTPLRDLHTVADMRRWRGRAAITRGKSLLAKLAGFFAGFPPECADTPVSVVMRRVGTSEVWERQFGNHRFRSFLRPARCGGEGTIYERFGALRFKIGLTVRGDELYFPVLSGSVLGVPFPRLFLPVSHTKESVDAQGRAQFDVSISLPLFGEVVTYKGWLEPVS